MLQPDAKYTGKQLLTIKEAEMPNPQLTDPAFQRWSTSLIFIFKDFFNLKRQMAIACCTLTRSNHLKLQVKNAGDI